MRLYAALAALCSLLACYASASQIPSIALTHIPGVLEKDKADAPYTRLISYLTAQLDYEVELRYVPGARANMLLNNQMVDCLFPNLQSEARVLETRFSTPVNHVRLYAFTLDEPRYTNLASLEGKLVVHIRGYLMSGLLNEESFKSVPVRSAEAAFGMLQSGRADIYLDYLPDLRFALAPETFSRLRYLADSPLIDGTDRFECHVTEAGRALLKDMDRLLATLDGEKMRSLLGDYYLP